MDKFTLDQLNKMGATPMFEGDIAHLPGGGLRPLGDIKYKGPNGEIFSYKPAAAGAAGYDQSGSFEQTSGNPASGGSEQTSSELLASGKYRDVPNLNGMTEEEKIAAIKGSPVYDPTKGPQINTGYGYQTIQNFKTNPGIGTGFSGNIKGPFKEGISKTVGAKYTEQNQEGNNQQVNQPDPKAIEDSINQWGQDTHASTPTTTGRSSADLLQLIKDTLASPPKQESLVQKEQEYKAQYIDPKQQEYNQAVQEHNQLLNDISSKKMDIKGQPVSSRYINNAIVYLDKQTADAVNAAEAKVKNAQDALDTQTKFVSTIISLTKDDEANALKMWEYEQNKAIQLNTLLNREETQQMTRDKAFLSGIQNAIKSGDMSPDNLTPSQKQSIEMAESRIYGLDGIGITELMHSSIKGNIISHGIKGNTGYVISEDPNSPSGFKTTTFTIPVVGSSGKTITMSQAKSLGLPLSLVGKNQDEISNDLLSDQAPNWFRDSMENKTQSSISEEGLNSMWKEFKKPIISESDILLKKPEPSTPDEVLSQTLDSFQQYADAGYSRSEIEDMWKSQNKATDIPGPISKILDEINF